MTFSCHSLHIFLSIIAAITYVMKDVIDREIGKTTGLCIVIWLMGCMKRMILVLINRVGIRTTSATLSISFAEIVVFHNILRTLKVTPISRMVDLWSITREIIEHHIDAFKNQDLHWPIVETILKAIWR